MILYGRNLSPYTRRVAVWLGLQERVVDRKELSVLDHPDEIAALSPVARVPVLALDDGTRMVEAWAICDWLDATAPERALLPVAYPERLAPLQRLALASAATDKAVALVYEKNRRDPALHAPAVIARIEGQIASSVAAIDAATPEQGWFGGAGPDGSDIAVVCLHDFIAATNPGLLEGAGRLAALATRANALPPFGDTRP